MDKAAFFIGHGKDQVDFVGLHLDGGSGLASWAGRFSGAGRRLLLCLRMRRSAERTFEGTGGALLIGGRGEGAWDVAGVGGLGRKRGGGEGEQEDGGLKREGAMHLSDNGHSNDSTQLCANRRELQRENVSNSAGRGSVDVSMGLDVCGWGEGEMGGVEEVAVESEFGGRVRGVTPRMM